jgi:uncharacterized repeat protein (TIGR01451 family)
MTLALPPTLHPAPRALAALRALALAACFAAVGPAQARAQTSVTALTGQSCAGTRFKSDLGCTAKDFTTAATFTQPPPGLASCVAGSTFQLDVILKVTSSSATRYDGAVFLGERANDPSANVLASTCSLGVFPASPSPFQDLDGNACGDFAANGSADLTIRGVTVYCAPAPGTNVLGLPYVLVFGNSSTANCSAANVTAATKSKCVSSVSSQVTSVIVQGYLRVTVATLPAADPQAFAFTATGTAAASPSSFTLAAGSTQVVQVPLGATGGDVTLQLDEATLPGWKPGATIACTSPSGSAASYVTVDGANRRIRAVLNATNYGADCTITNEKLFPNLLLVQGADRSAATPGDVVTYTLVVQNTGAAAATNVVLGGPVNRSLAWRPDAFGPGVAFQLVDGSPPAGLSLGTPAYSADGGATWTLAPTSGGGGAPAGSDGRVTSWKLPINGSMPAGSQFTLTYQATVK